MSNETHLHTLPSRRDVVRALAGIGLGLGVVSLSEPGAAKNKKKKHQKIKIRRNAFGCVDVGARCENAEQCCSGICTGKKGKKICEAHGQSTCQAGSNVCVPINEALACVTAAGIPGHCGTTTGNAGYCVVHGSCGPCKRDADCEPFYGEGAACGFCAGCLPYGGNVCMANTLP